MKKIWALFCLISLFLSVVLAGTLVITANVVLNISIWLSSLLIFLIVVIELTSITILTLKASWVQTPNNTVDMVECFGKYIGKPLKAGPHILFPWFVKIRARVFLGEQRLGLYLNNKESTQSGSGDVEFENCSSGLMAYLFFRIVNPERAIYAIAELFRSIEERTDHLLRSFFGAYTLDEAIELKSYFRLRNVACLIDFSANSSKKFSKDHLMADVSEADFMNSPYYKTLERWGCVPIGISISDIEVPDDIKEQRVRVLTAEKDNEVAAIELKTSRVKAKKTVVDAEAAKRKTELEGEGQSNRLSEVLKTVGDKEKAIHFLINGDKWNAIAKLKEGHNLTLIEGSSDAQLGAGIGAGINSSNKSKN